VVEQHGNDGERPQAVDIGAVLHDAAPGRPEAAGT
jgi:hypothetical protein